MIFYVLRIFICLIIKRPVYVETEMTYTIAVLNNQFSHGIIQGDVVVCRDRLVVRTLRCGRSNPGSNPGPGITSFFFLFFFSNCTFLLGNLFAVYVLILAVFKLKSVKSG